MASSDESPYYSSYARPVDTAASLSEDYLAYKDIRSSKRCQSRFAKRSAKYYGFRGVDPNWIGQPCDPVWRSHQRDMNTAATPIQAMPQGLDTFKNEASLESNARSRVYTKRDMWLDRELNIWPLDRRHHVGKKIREKWAWKDHERTLQRGTKPRARMMAFAAENGSYWDNEAIYGCTGAHDYIENVYHYAGYEDYGQWRLPDDYSNDEIPQASPSIPDCDVIDGFVILNDISCDGDDDDYCMVEEQDFDIVSISSVDSAWEIGRHD